VGNPRSYYHALRADYVIRSLGVRAEVTLKMGVWVLRTVDDKAYVENPCFFDGDEEISAKGMVGCIKMDR
jgi:hypothetical protein